MVRIVTALILATGLWLLIRKAPQPLFCFAATVVIGIATWECYRMISAEGSRPFKGVGVAISVAVAYSFVGWYEVHLPFVLGGAMTLALAMLLRDRPAEMLDSVLRTVFPVLFIGLSFGFLIGLRTMPGEDGDDLLMLLFLCVILADTAAYYVGRSIGRNLMAPRLSPKKTWEGAVGGVGASTFGGWVAHVWFFQSLPLAHSLILGLVLGLAAIAGDLVESMVKRAAEVKDSSRLLPGHGGVLDRTDSLLFSGPILFYYYRFVLQAMS
jgi:phosphatidate cytidylyltransferase